MSGEPLAGGIVGHERARESLRRALDTGTFHPGYLFAGPKGVGKTLLAEAFVRVFLCVSEGGEPCGGCLTCRHPREAPHPDLSLIAPLEGKKSIGIAQVHEAGAFLALSPAWGKRKALIIEPADSLTAEAANALLKTLEEPPPGRTIILVTSRPGSLPSTVRSRCRQVLFGALTEEETAAVLRRQSWPAEAARRAAAIAEGSPGLALERDGELWQKTVERVSGLLEALADGDRGAAMAFAEAFREGREGALLTLNVLLGWLRSAARRRLGVKDGAGHPPLPALFDSFSEDRLLGLLEAGFDARRNLEGNVNPKLAMTVYLAAWEGSPVFSPRSLASAVAGGGVKA